ncbi:MAG: crotonobetainyl-CoA:carnitine CoA-transferase CaiB-like acyl-CoA transferase [Gammaproteobacteria bacterium]|jgi:crotonobetainyl-CoA:carnitine CoA-transferase CaiB-like acyl-CoA transferase
MSTPTEQPLARYTVLDLTIARAGPSAVRLLADWGARVIRIEPPPGENKDGRSITGDRHGPDDQNLHRNKRGLTIDLKNPSGRALFAELVGKADVVVENFRADVKYRLGVDYETLKKVNPKIILASISGFGQTGPYSVRAGVDQIVQGLSGLMSVTGHPGGGPLRAGIAVSDTAAGMFLGQGILLALLHREHTGVGQWVHTSMLESMISKMDFQAARYTVLGEVAEQQGNDHPTLVPMGTFTANDGLVNIAASTSRMFKSLCSALSADQLLDDPRFSTNRARVENKIELRRAINDFTEQFTVDELVELLAPLGVPCGPIYNLGETFADPQVKHLQMTLPAHDPVRGDIELLRSPINLSACPHPERFHHPGPMAGQHNHEILTEFGYDGAAIEALEKTGAIE